MGSVAETADVAVYLRGLKARSNQSYKALARQVKVGSSTLHRYCSGEQFPADFRVVRSFAAACGASTSELQLLEQLWSADPRNPAIAAGLPPSPAATAASDPGSAQWAGPTKAEEEERAGEEETAREEETAGEEKTAEAAASTVTGAADAVAEVSARATPVPRRWSARRAWLVAAGFAVVAAVMVAATVFVTRSGGGAEPRESELLFSSACQGPVSMGQHDTCVEEVQRLLASTGVKIGVDGDFGPETLRRVTAFQVLAGLPVRGVVDDATKRALYAGQVSMRSWPPARVEQRIREVFPEEPDRAVAIAKCQSLLDPFWVLPNVDTSRNWGVFQISDRRLRELDGTPRRAFDPEWNIWAARELWRTRGGFAGNWPYCDEAYPRSRAPSSPPPPSARGGPGN
ncbi:helix-turn-helix domain-containing protein [Cryptosporangium arvum]|uniref:Putative peptidoglycan-binding domain-containing protein n=1 Tax=Cryptosporangium arvum DSM 44712 TaxID=927661 RepID=A0A010ZL86_9ACTN|nr:helix-turn-helix domain-containing protein [Cryptosporangium arvum]EXG79424.1 putative peptidoglycan-binding domain-containing protein [Cryptosporangium arvum DSM 44712]